MPAKTLNKLISDAGLKPLNKAPSVPICGITSDSRKVQPGYAFVAIKGESSDGWDYIPQALRNGAAVVIGSRSSYEQANLPYIQLAGDMRANLAHLAAAFYGHPARDLCMIGVTGTDGKTTTTTIIHQILSQAGIKTGMISTLSALIGDKALDTGFHVTTPDAPEIQSYLAEMVKEGMSHCVLETTSHGLAQSRATACDFDLAVVTNVTHEHLDYHGTYQNYLAAKGLLFSGLEHTAQKRMGNLRKAVLNKDDQSYEYLKRISPVGQISYSAVNEADLWADTISDGPEGLRFTLHAQEKTWDLSTPMHGVYNVSNCLAAIGATCLGLGLPIEHALEALQNAKGIAGRMEKIEMGQDFTAIVDFAHTPNALEAALRTARTQTKGRLIAVFGSAGLRDRAKRRMMPEVAVKLADISILTAEDPRSEPLRDILAEMAQAAIGAGAIEGQDFMRVGDRREAIRKAIALAKPEDLVISLGKGHEQSMCFGSTEYDWDDRTAMRAALAEHLGIDGPPMPYLPSP